MADWFSEPLQWKDFITLAGVAVAATLGSIQYARTAKREFEKPLREAQLKLFLEATSVAATIANLQPGDQDREKHYANFLRLFYGPMAVLEDIDRRTAPGVFTVEKAMVAFKYALKRNEPSGKLNMLSLGLAHTCRRALGTSWNTEVSLGDGEGYRRNIEEYWKQQSGEA